MRTGVYPGSFNPPTVAHLAIAEAAVTTHCLDRLDLVVSRVPLGKDVVERPTLEHRLHVLERTVTTRGWLSLVVTDQQLYVQLADGYDVVVMGADKWHQLHDPGFYGDSEHERDRAIAALPRPAIVDRPPHPAPEQYRLDVAAEFTAMSSTHVRAGRHEWMAPEAAAFDAETGAWSDPARYDRWLTR